MLFSTVLTTLSRKRTLEVACLDLVAVQQNVSETCQVNHSSPSARVATIRKLRSKRRPASVAPQTVQKQGHRSGDISHLASSIVESRKRQHRLYSDRIYCGNRHLRTMVEKRNRNYGYRKGHLNQIADLFYARRAADIFHFDIRKACNKLDFKIRLAVNKLPFAAG